MSRLARPLSRDAVRKADDAFYAAHPEMVKGGVRQPLSGDDPAQAGMREQWRGQYAAAGGPVTGGDSASPAAIKEDAARADQAAKQSFASGPVASPVQGCSASQGSGVTAKPATPAPANEPEKPCGAGKPPCTVTSTRIACGHGGRGGALGPGNTLQVVPRDEYSGDVISLTAQVAGCGKPVTWEISGPVSESVTKNAHKVTAKAWPWRGAVGLSPLSRWAIRAVPQNYRVRASTECGSLADVYQIQAYPTDKIAHSVSPDEMPFLKVFQDGVINGFLKPIFGDSLELEFLKGSLAVDASWKEDDASWQAYYAYNIALGFSPLFGVTAKVSVIDVLGAMVSIPPTATKWLQKFVGKAFYIGASGKIGCSGNLERTGPDTFAAWSFQATGGIGVEVGLEIKAASEKVFKGSATGSAGLSATAKVGPKAKEADPYVLLDAKFDGIAATLKIQVASGWYSFEEQYVLIEEKILLSNHQATVFNAT